MRHRLATVATWQSLSRAVRGNWARCCAFWTHPNGEIHAFERISTVARDVHSEKSASIHHRVEENQDGT